MSRRKSFTAAVAGLCLVLGLAAATTGPASAATGPVYTVMNTSESPPDGVYFRPGPDTSGPTPAYGLGVFMGEQVQLQCYAFGQAIGPYNNTLWYYSLNVSRPVNYDGQSNQGMINAHYINDGQAANVVDAGVPACINNLPPASAPAAAPVVSLAQGPAAPFGYRYAITLSGYPANSSVSIVCYDTVSPGGFEPFTLTTDSNGNAFTQAYCYSGDGPDHWVVAGGVESNHVSWGTVSGGGGGTGGGGTTSPAPPPTPDVAAMVYYSPFPSWYWWYEPNASTTAHPVKRLQKSAWASGSACDPNKARLNTPTTYSGKTVTSLSGWSLGRDGVLYELNALNTSNATLARIKYVLLIDPGGFEELNGSCDKTYGRMLATWLRAVPDARLVILSGPTTLDYAYAQQHGLGGSQGIQQIYFNAIRNVDSSGSLTSRVLICNYQDSSESVSQSHKTIYNEAKYLIGRSIIETCPQLPAPLSFDGYWHP